MSDHPGTDLKHDPTAGIAELADRCVMCGLCLPHCPTYALDASEAESPRGRIRLARALAEDPPRIDTGLRLHLDSCLGCLQCERVCPSQVQYGEILVRTRALIGPAPNRPTWLLGVLKRPLPATLLLAAARALHLRTWLPSLLRTALPKRTIALQVALAWLGPRPRARARPPGPRSEGKRHVALFPGCIASIEDAAALQAAQDLLQAAGFSVQRLAATCCGALDLHDGATAQATRAANRLQAACRNLPADTPVLTATPGCLGTLRRQLPHLRIEDATGYLARHGTRLQFRALGERVAVHLPCTSRNVSRDSQDVLALLRLVPGLSVLEVPESPGCCGAAGSHALQFPAQARRLRAQVLRHVADLAADRLLSSNIGCRLHLSAGNRSLPTEHPLTLLARQLEPRSAP